MEDAIETHIHVRITDDGRMWVNSVGECLLRVQGIKKVVIEDGREEWQGIYLRRWLRGYGLGMLVGALCMGVPALIVLWPW